MSSTDLLQAEGLVKIYGGKRVVNQVDIVVHRREIVGLLGPNGAGKTTTFYMMVGLTHPDEGRVFLDGEDITVYPMHMRARKGISYLAQEPSIFRKLTVRQNLLAILEILNIPPSERKSRLEKGLTELGISHLARQKAMSLSGGERRRLEISRALITGPRFMLLDEPFAGIDPLAINDIQQIIRQLRDRGLGVIITDHNVRETLSVCDKAYIISQGEIIVEGPPDKIISNEVARSVYLGENFDM
ncbi:MAG: LPS export ABC transporter ATP-binding protein [Desulfobulbaceae bacterium]|nr:LPS export ABC transporter ATP-binding protein [Desulfobulbaceae bacterium]